MKIIMHTSTQLNYTINSSNMYLNPAPVKMDTSEGTEYWRHTIMEWEHETAYCDTSNTLLTKAR